MGVSVRLIWRPLAGDGELGSLLTSETVGDGIEDRSDDKIRLLILKDFLTLLFSIKMIVSVTYILK
jgi:hypothetical protein